MAHRKPQQALVKTETRAAQHALADPARAHVEVILEPAVDQNEDEKDQAQQHEAGDAVELDAEDRPGKVLAGNRLVDDDLWQFERIIQKWERQQRDDDEVDLFAPAVAQDETVDRRRQRIARRGDEAAGEQSLQPAAEPEIRGSGGGLAGPEQGHRSVSILSKTPGKARRTRAALDLGLPRGIFAQPELS